jgi:hypothetical protein
VTFFLPDDPRRQGMAAMLRPLWEVQAREKRRIQQEVLQVRGLMPLLMKPRNGYRWTREEKRELVRMLRSLYSVSPYLLTLALPGSVLFLPLLAWWLDRRRVRRKAEGTPV